MKSFLLFFVFLLLPVISFAEQISLKFSQVPLESFLVAVYSEILGKNYVISPDLFGYKKVKLDVSLESSDLSKFVVSYLETIGVSVSELGGIVYINKKSDSTNLMPQPALNGPAFLQTPQSSFSKMIEPTVFEPKARSPEFLCEMVVKVFSSTCSPVGHRLFLTASKKETSKLIPFLIKIDQSLPRVQVTANFVEVTTNGKEGYGISLLANTLTKSMSIISPGTLSGAFSFRAPNFQLVLDALKSDGRFKQVASPSGFVTSGDRFTVSIGDEVPTLSSIQQSNTSTGNPVQSITYRPSGVLLDVLPKVAIGHSSTPRIEASVRDQVSTFSQTTNGVNGSPTLSKREFSTSVSLDDGETIILGGLTGSKNSVSQSSFFGLPLAKTTQDDHSELLLLLTVNVTK